MKKPAEDSTFAFDTFIAIDWSGATGHYDGIAVEVRSSAIVEIYPTLFRKSGTGSLAKLRSHDLKTALAVFGSDSMHRSWSGDLSDHETDALISAAGLRSLARIPATWSHPELRSPRVQREGWIFGVGGGSCQHAESRGTLLRF